MSLDAVIEGQICCEVSKNDALSPYSERSAIDLRDLRAEYEAGSCDYWEGREENGRDRSSAGDRLTVAARMDEGRYTAEPWKSRLIEETINRSSDIHVWGRGQDWTNS